MADSSTTSTDSKTSSGDSGGSIGAAALSALSSTSLNVGMNASATSTGNFSFGKNTGGTLNLGNSGPGLMAWGALVGAAIAGFFIGKLVMK